MFGWEEEHAHYSMTALAEGNVYYDLVINSFAIIEIFFTSIAEGYHNNKRCKDYQMIVLFIENQARYHVVQNASFFRFHYTLHTTIYLTIVL